MNKFLFFLFILLYWGEFLKKNKINQRNNGNQSEFQYENDDFFEVRQKGIRQWILKHILYGRNKIFFVFWASFTIIAILLSTYGRIFMGITLEAFELADSIFDKFWYYVIIFAIIMMFTPIVGLIANWLREILAQRMEKETRNELYLNLLGKSQSFHDKQRLGDIMAIATNDVRQLNFLISPSITLILESILRIILPLVMMAMIYPLELIIFPSTFIVIYYITIRIYISTLAPVAQNKQIEFGNLNSTLNELLSGIEIIKGMNQEKKAKSDYLQKAKKNAKLGITEGDIQAKYLPGLMVALILTLSLGHSIYLYQKDMISIGMIIGYLALINDFFGPAFYSLEAYAIYSRAIAGGQRVLNVINEKTEIFEIEKPIDQKIEGNIKFDNVSFQYPNTTKLVLKNISFEVKSGQNIAIVGTTGSGKTTCTKLISRLYDINQGEIRIDGNPLQHYSLQSLRDQISYIEQDIYLFSKSVYENIAFGRKTTREEIIEAAKEAQAHDFIMNMPEGYETKVGERGVKLSGGERQRIAIARAFLSNPKILILDDSTSAIDSATEDKIQKAINRILKDRTTIIITHRLSQIRWADHIILFKRGTIIAQGNHFELLKTSEEYQKIFLTRFDKSLNELLEVSS